MKILRNIFLFFLSLFILVGILVATFIWLTYDNDSTKLNPNLEPREIETLVSDDLKDSLNNISETDYSENNITLNIMVEDINALIVKGVRENLNSNYLISEDYILEKYGLSIKTIYAYTKDDALYIRGTLSGFGFYHTTVTLACSMKIENRDLVIQFDSFSLGKRLGVKKNIALKIFDLLNVNLGEKNGFDLDTLSYRLNIDSLISNLNLDNEILNALFSSDISLAIGSDRISLILDTSDIFNKGIELPNYVYGIDINEKLDNAIVSNDLKLEINNDELNTLIKDMMKGLLFNQDLMIGDNSFNFKIEDLYLDLKNSEIRSNIYIDKVKSSLNVGIDITEEINENGEMLLMITPKVLKIGSKVIGENQNIIKPIEINAKSLGIDTKAIIKNIVIDKNRSIIEISVAVIGL